MKGLLGTNDIPQTWRNILASVQAVCPTAVLAGGCLRDLDNGAEVKDLDIFIQAHGMTDAQSACKVLGAAGLAVSYELSDTTAYPEDQNLEVVLVAELIGGADQRIPVQLIFVSWDTGRIIERFDYGICRLSFDGMALTRPSEYDLDKAAKVFRLRRELPTPVAMRGSIHRYARLVQKYPGWTWWPYEDPSGFITFIP